jgi:hypothetical protein
MAICSCIAFGFLLLFLSSSEDVILAFVGSIFFGGMFLACGSFFLVSSAWVCEFDDRGGVVYRFARSTIRFAWDDVVEVHRHEIAKWTLIRLRGGFDVRVYDFVVGSESIAQLAYSRTAASGVRPSESAKRE